MKHKHAELIHAWADGAEIQWRDPKYDLLWTDIGNPNFYEVYEYRIKPEPKPDVVKHFLCDFIYVLNTVRFLDDACYKKNLRLTFDGETGKLKSAEVL
jgi:hypothetical protein